MEAPLSEVKHIGLNKQLKEDKRGYDGLGKYSICFLLTRYTVRLI